MVDEIRLRQNQGLRQNRPNFETVYGRRFISSIYLRPTARAGSQQIKMAAYMDLGVRWDEEVNTNEYMVSNSIKCEI